MKVEMPQIFQVLRCYKCLAFQVHQTKKSNKFACKICDEKQSIKRHYGIGIAKDCRMHVQKLNMKRGEMDKTILEDDSDEYEKEITSTEDTSDTTNNVKQTSKWLSYIDTQIEDDIDENTNDTETNNNNKKRWQRDNSYINYKAKKNLASKGKHSNVIDANELDDVENVLNNDNTKNVFGKRTLSENGDDVRVDKVSKSVTHYNMILQMNNNDLEEKNIKDYMNINNSKLPTTKMNESSKWAKFIDRDEDIGEENCDNGPKPVENCLKNIKSFFSLCDESDIDDVLDI